MGDRFACCWKGSCRGEPWDGRSTAGAAFLRRWEGMGSRAQAEELALAGSRGCSPILTGGKLERVWTDTEQKGCLHMERWSRFPRLPDTTGISAWEPCRNSNSTCPKGMLLFPSRLSPPSSYKRHLYSPSYQGSNPWSFDPQLLPAPAVSCSTL